MQMHFLYNCEEKSDVPAYRSTILKLPSYLYYKWLYVYIYMSILICKFTSPSSPSHMSIFYICFSVSSLQVSFTIPCFYSQHACFNMEKAMAPHSSTLAWKIPWMEGPGRLQSMGSPRVKLDWASSLSLFTFMHWKRKWQPTPVFLPGESQGRGSLVGCGLWGHRESDTTEAT